MPSGSNIWDSSIGDVKLGDVVPLWAPSVGLTGSANNFTAAVSITTPNNVITSCTFTSGSPCVLPTVATWVGGQYMIFNQTTMTVAVWPQPGDRIDATVTGTCVLLDAGKRCTFYAPTAGVIISAQMGVTSV